MLILVAAIISICLFTPFFNIKTVEVRGNEAIAAERIIEAAAIPPETNIFKLRKKNVRTAVSKIPEIETVAVSRRLPNKLRLTVTETAPALYFPYATGFAVTNEKGRVMALTDDSSSLDLLQITGLEIKNAEICEKISVQDTVKFDIILDTVKQLQDKGLLTDLRSCHFDNLSDFYAYLKDGTKIIFGKTTELDYKISVLSAVLPQVNREEGAYIDLTTPSRAVYGTKDPDQAPSPAPSESDGAAQADAGGETEKQDGAESTAPTGTAAPDRDGAKEDDTTQSEASSKAEPSTAPKTDN